MAALRRFIQSVAHNAKSGTFAVSDLRKQTGSKATEALKVVAAAGTCVTAVGFYYYCYNNSDPGSGRPGLTRLAEARFLDLALPSVSATDNKVGYSRALTFYTELNRDQLNYIKWIY